MDNNPEHKEQKRIGTFMVVMMWVLFLGLLMVFFEGLIDKQTNPNQSLNTQYTDTGVREVELQLNRYRIFFEEQGFPVSRIQIQAIPRDGGTYIAKNRGIDKLMSKETSVVNINKAGFTASVISGNAKKNKMNNILRLKKGIV